MISRSGGGGFLKTHYDWVAAGAGLVALAAAAAFCLVGGDVETEIQEVMSRVEGRGAEKPDVVELDLKPYFDATNSVRVESAANAVQARAAGFFGSEKRILCRDAACGRATPEKFDAEKNLVCAFCGFTQEVARAVKVLDADGDGLPDDWERRYGLNPGDAADAEADADGDDFTNLEEYQAKTDPMDKGSHPDYLDSLRVRLPLKETYMPFVFFAAHKIPSNWRCSFFDPKQKNDYGRVGLTITAVVGEEIGASGYVLKSYEQKEARRAIQGGQGLTKTVDVSEVVVERKGDGKKVTLVIGSKKAKPAAVDIQATLVYSRRAVKTFDVVAGSEVVLSGAKYKVVSIKGTAKEARVLVENVLTGKQRTIEALEP